jgi:hypothetical protein
VSTGKSWAIVYLWRLLLLTGHSGGVRSLYGSFLVDAQLVFLLLQRFMVSFHSSVPGFTHLQLLIHAPLDNAKRDDTSFTGWRTYHSADRPLPMQTRLNFYLDRLTSSSPSTFASTHLGLPYQNSSGTPQMDDMADLKGLVYRATIFTLWTQMRYDPTELPDIMADMSKLSESHLFIVSRAARALLTKIPSPSRLNEYQSALCHVYAVRGLSMHEYEKAAESIEQAGVHVETLSKAVAALGVPEEHHLLRDLSAKIEELKR